MESIDHIGKQIAELVGAGQSPQFVDPVPGCGKPFVLVPKDMQTVDLEHLLPNPTEHTAKFGSASLDAFVSYAGYNGAGAGSRCFVSDDIKHRALSARLYFRFGEVANPQWRERDIANLLIDQTEEGEQIARIAGRYSQQTLAELIEDWADNLTCMNGDDTLNIKNAVVAVRNLKLDAKGSYESSDGELKATRSAMEEVEASSKSGPLPTRLVFTCQPFPELGQYEFRYRISVSTDRESKQPFAITAIRHEAVYERIVKDFRQAVEQALRTADHAFPVLTGWV